MSKYTFIRDTREQDGNGWLFDADDKYCNGTVVQTLKTGDYSIVGYEHVFAVERKRNAGELAGNICEKRFERELERLSKFKYAFIVCEFPFADLSTFPTNSGVPKSKWPKLRVTPNFLISKVTEYEIKYGVSVIFAGSPINAKRIVYSLCKHVVKNEV